MSKSLSSIYRKLYAHFGPQRWWPADTPFEVMVGAILTQNTSWSNVEKAIRNLKENNLLCAKKLHSLPHKKLAALLRPAGYFNIKATRLKNFLSFFIEGYDGDISAMRTRSMPLLRRELLSVNGIGRETADSILLYALHKPIFVVDAYTKRILARHSLAGEGASYQEIQKFFMQNLKKEVQLFNEYHALLVRVGKDYCLKNKPKCAGCPLQEPKVPEVPEA